MNVILTFLNPDKTIHCTVSVPESRKEDVINEYEGFELWDGKKKIKEQKPTDDSVFYD